MRILCDIQATQRYGIWVAFFREIMIKNNLLGHHAHKCNIDGEIHGFSVCMVALINELLGKKYFQERRMFLWMSWYRYRYKPNEHRQTELISKERKRYPLVI